MMKKSCCCSLRAGAVTAGILLSILSLAEVGFELWLLLSGRSVDLNYYGVLTAVGVDALLFLLNVMLIIGACLSLPRTMAVWMGAMSVYVIIRLGVSIAFTVFGVPNAVATADATIQVGVYLLAPYWGAWVVLLVIFLWAFLTVYSYSKVLTGEDDKEEGVAVIEHEMETKKVEEGVVNEGMVTEVAENEYASLKKEEGVGNGAAVNKASENEYVSLEVEEGAVNEGAVNGGAVNEGAVVNGGAVNKAAENEYVSLEVEERAVNGGAVNEGADNEYASL
ncbi:uncharacterized protein LOC144884494 [Branchiostoma floridae x Branchiostoma japonicum]